MNRENFLKEHAPCYIYNQREIIDQCNKLKTALKDFKFLYSIKTNPFPAVVHEVYEQGFGSDAASANEVRISADSGMSPNQIFYSAPGKTDRDIIECYGKCVMTADSFWDIHRMNKEAENRGEILKIAVRINPNFSMTDEVGNPAKFGIDEDRLPELEKVLSECFNVEMIGIHVHVRSQILDYKLIGQYYIRCFKLAQKINNLENVNIEFINFGSGIGALYDKAKDKPVDLEKLSEMVVEIVRENKETLNAELYIETGRFVVCNAGTYYTRIVDIKVSHGKKYLIVQNGMNGFLRPTISNMLNKMKAAGELSLTEQEPLYTKENEFEVRILNNSKKIEKVDIVGNLCTSMDIICEDKELPYAEIGDIVEITNAGSYAYSLSPLFFASHDLPGEYYSLIDGNIL
ncbi:diaminopimelate decarboxylase family protein [Anaerosphaera multitolerans]|uniref:Pyridoxal-dependent decarboxylase n=1 Tax=Anaerosphaera multitolerans TaxID=2487351 RepID=A0A437S724_9FIRM|nr:pyridoxal-dependent decarboxylase [Anaerosphaera multitolerans]RVU54816.1 pyridoxal-dependent decarboxylase [Anaerosphaera multitolerans]